MTIEEKIEKLELKYCAALLKCRDMMETSQTPGAYMGYRSQGEVCGAILFDLNSLREHPKEMKDVLPMGDE